MDNIRLFLGLTLPDELSDYLSERAEKLREHYAFRTWTHSADYHITLHFLGNVSAASLPALSAAAQEAAVDAGPVGLALTGPGLFGSPETPRVLWCGADETAPAAPDGLHFLHRRLGERLSDAIGFEPEARPYHPHITLARSGTSPVSLSALTAVWMDDSRIDNCRLEKP